MSITPDTEARIKASLTPDDYQDLVDEISEARREARSSRLEASTEKARADQNADTLARVNDRAAEDRRLAQAGRTAALRFSNPSLSLAEEAEARRTLVNAHFPEGA
ncbi:hypothetical protein ACTXI9_01715 [Brachybacterium alimentarium]|uniref:hypothetical protein n=1 Tax=Brachybacterium alimentarium TaxID=47845 RepID=UPI003FD14A2F